MEFKLYLIKDFQRLKDDENERLSLAWNLNRTLSKINYRIHTDAIKANLIPSEVSSAQASFTYASEADILNVALFGRTAKEWRAEHADQDGNMRDHASIQQLLVLANIESMNAEFIKTMPDNIIPISGAKNQSPCAVLPLQIYLSGRVQQHYGIKPTQLRKDTEIADQPSTWLSLWRCDHILSDKTDQHLFLFSHATSFFSIVVYQKGIDFNQLINQFHIKLLDRLEPNKKPPEELEVTTAIITGNPRSLITTMKQILFESRVIIEDFFESYEEMERRINGSLRSKEHFRPNDRFTEQLQQESSFLNN